MLNAKEIVLDCIAYDSEREWFELKENWFKKEQLGEYISSLSNSAAMLGKPFAYMIWGFSDDKHEIVGTTFNYNIDVDKEPLQHYLARNLEPSIHF